MEQVAEFIPTTDPSNLIFLYLENADEAASQLAQSSQSKSKGERLSSETRADACLQKSWL
jgi:hypothetical protein